MATTNDVAEFDTNARNVEEKTRVSLVPSRQGNYSLFCLSEKNRLRRAATLIVESRYPFYIILNVMSYLESRAL